MCTKCFSANHSNDIPLKLDTFRRKIRQIARSFFERKIKRIFRKASGYLVQSFPILCLQFIGPCHVTIGLKASICNLTKRYKNLQNKWLYRLQELRSIFSYQFYVIEIFNWCAWTVKLVLDSTVRIIRMTHALVDAEFLFLN